MKDKFLYFVALIPVLIIVLLLQIYKVEPFESFSLRFNDINFELQDKEISKEVVFVAVDEPSVNTYGRWPWKREKLALGVNNLSQADVVLMDMIFSEPTSKEQDTILGESISNLNASVCGFFLRHNATQEITDDELDVLSDSSLDLLQSQVAKYANPNFPSAEFAEMNILPILESCTLSGSFSTFRASDDKFRLYPVAMYFQNILYPSLGIQGLRLKFNKDISRVDAHHVKINDKEISLNDDGLVLVNFYKRDQYKIISFLDVATGVVKPDYFKGKIVILGITEVGSGDIVSTPIGSIPGPLVHYTFISNLLQGHLIREPKMVTSWLITFFVFLPFILVIFFSKILHRVLMDISVYLLVYIFVRYLFVSEMLYIDLFFPLIALFLSAVAVEGIAFTQQENRGKFLKDTFSSYLSGDLLNQLIANPDSIKLGGEKKELTILFSDIRGFTTISESMTPEKLIEILNRYFTPMTQSVLDNGGMLDKYIGDAVMAFFNAPVDVEQHADAACHSALSMIEKLDALNKDFETEGIIPIHIGIGLNTAEVIVGNIGSDAKKDYTVIGDGVNLASRVEGLTKNYTVQILITEFTVAKLTENFIYREIEPVKVKGKDEAVILFELMPDSDVSLEIKRRYEDALDIYKGLDLEKAKALFAQIVNDFDDGASKYMLSKIQKNEHWGVHKMTTK